MLLFSSTQIIEHLICVKLWSLITARAMTHTSPDRSQALPCVNDHAYRLRHSAGLKPWEELVEVTFQGDSPPLLYPPLVLPHPAAPRTDPQQDASLPLCPHWAAADPLDHRDPAEVQLLNDTKAAEKELEGMI